MLISSSWKSFFLEPLTCSRLACWWLCLPCSCHLFEISHVWKCCYSHTYLIAWPGLEFLAGNIFSSEFWSHFPCLLFPTLLLRSPKPFKSLILHMQPVFSLLCWEKIPSSLLTLPLLFKNLPVKFTGVVLFSFTEFGTWWVFLICKYILQLWGNFLVLFDDFLYSIFLSYSLFLELLLYRYWLSWMVL